jgi:cytochrome c
MSASAPNDASACAYAGSPPRKPKSAIDLGKPPGPRLCAQKPSSDACPKITFRELISIKSRFRRPRSINSEDPVFHPSTKHLPRRQEMRLQSNVPTSLMCGLALAFGAAAFAGSARAADEDAARVLARQSNCFKCHSVAKKKEGPAWHDVAVKYKGKPEAEAKLIHHITSGEKAKFDDGHEEDHAIVKTKDPVQIKNLVDWILSL